MFRLVLIPWHFLKLDSLRRCQDAFEKLDVRNSRIEPFFVQDEKLHSYDLEIRCVYRIRIENIVKTPFLFVNRFLHFLSDGVAGMAVRIQQGNLSCRKPERAVDLVLDS